MPDEQPYRPGYKGFDEKDQERAMATAERSQETKRDVGQDVENKYVEEGAQEASRRTGDSADSYSKAVERGAKRAREE